MLAGIVTATFNPASGLLTLSGDKHGNKIVIRDAIQYAPHNLPSVTDVGLMIRGINTKIREAIDNSDWGIPNETMPPKGAVTIPSTRREIRIDMAGGNDSVTIYNIAVYGPLIINMGAGNDKLRMTAVNAFTFTGQTKRIHRFFSTDGVPIDTGADFFRRIILGGEVTIDAGPGRDRVILRQILAWHTDSDSALSVEMGAGKHDVLKIAASIADNAFFGDTLGAHGKLRRSDNVFGNESDVGFDDMA